MTETTPGTWRLPCPYCGKERHGYGEAAVRCTGCKEPFAVVDGVAVIPEERQPREGELMVVKYEARDVGPIPYSYFRLERVSNQPQLNQDLGWTKSIVGITRAPVAQKENLK